jgi:hypothetical protein
VIWLAAEQPGVDGERATIITCLVTRIGTLAYRIRTQFETAGGLLAA